MFKSRLEALSDGIFAIVFTLLVIEIKVPEQLINRNQAELSRALIDLLPLFFAYFVSFVVLAMFWMSHSFMYNMFVKTTTRTMMYLNLLYLSLIALIPFSAQLIGQNLDIDLAVIFYGVHIFLISIVNTVTFLYAMNSHEIDTSHNSSRLIKQSRTRQILISSFMIFGIIAASFSYTHLAFGLYMLPILFNIAPGSLDFMEKALGIELS